MEQEQLLENLAAIAEELGIEVRHIHLDCSSAGGLCKLKDKWVLILDKDSPLNEQVDIAVLALKDRPELESIYLRPQVRELIEH